VPKLVKTPGERTPAGLPTAGGFVLSGGRINREKESRYRHFEKCRSRDSAGSR